MRILHHWQTTYWVKNSKLQDPRVCDTLGMKMSNVKLWRRESIYPSSILKSLTRNSINRKWIARTDQLKLELRPDIFCIYGLNLINWHSLGIYIFHQWSGTVSSLVDNHVKNICSRVLSQNNSVWWPRGVQSRALTLKNGVRKIMNFPSRCLLPSSGKCIYVFISSRGRATCWVICDTVPGGWKWI